MIDYLATVLSQYSNSPVILDILERWNASVDPSVDVDDWYRMVWDVSTAQGYGLDVWGRIVGLPNGRVVRVVGGGQYLGYEEAQPEPTQNAFNQAPFWSGVPASENYSLTDEAFRLLIYAKALANISDGSVPSYNRILRLLFPGRGNAFVTNTGDMTAILTFLFPLLPYEVSVIKDSTALEPPTGVNFDIMSIDVTSTFGFQEAGDSASPFNNGVFFAGFL